MERHLEGKVLSVNLPSAHWLEALLLAVTNGHYHMVISSEDQGSRSIMKAQPLVGLFPVQDAQAIHKLGIHYGPLSNASIADL
jgi:hypothetical protein